jgi:hypothetical protein
MAGAYSGSSPYHYGLSNPVSNNDPTGAVTRNDIYGYIGDLYGSSHGGSWEKGKGFSFWGADDPMAWYTGASIIEKYELYGQMGITDSWEGSQNSFYQNGSGRGSDLLFEGTATVRQVDKPAFIKGKIKGGKWQTDEIIYPDDWGGSSKWLGPENSLGVLKARAHFEQNAIHNGLESAQAKAKAEGLDSYHLTKFTDAAKAAIGFRQMSYGAVAILASPFVIEAGVSAAPAIISGVYETGLATHTITNIAVNSIKSRTMMFVLRNVPLSFSVMKSLIKTRDGWTNVTQHTLYDVTHIILNLTVGVGGAPGALPLLLNGPKD